MGTVVESGKSMIVMGPDALAAELRKVIRRGLPADRKVAENRLIHLRSVVARATHPDDVYSRLDSFNQTMERLLVEMGDDGFGPAARILFAVAPGMAGTTLTTRRQHCANLLDYDFDHFRKHVEARILVRMAEELHRDLVRYRSRLRRGVTAYETSRPTPEILPQDFTREDEHVSRVWSELYRVRAERIAVRLAETDDDRAPHRQAQEEAGLRLQGLIDEYVLTYGRQQIPIGDLSYSVEGLEKLIVWRSLPQDNADLAVASDYSKAVVSLKRSLEDSR